MRTVLLILIFFCLISYIKTDKSVKSENPEIQVTDTGKDIIKNKLTVALDTIMIAKAIKANLSVLVLPPHDAIANEGISPDIKKYLEKIITNDTILKLIQFPHRQLMSVSYQNIFDKKYCKSITDKIKADIIIMSKLELAAGTGNMIKDKWNFKIKIYNTNTGIQKKSKLVADNLTNAEIENFFITNKQELFIEIKSSR